MDRARAAAASQPGDEIEELDCVRLLGQLVSEGVTYPVGSIGTVVHKWRGGDDLEVEFSEPQPTVATLRTSDVEVVWRS